MLEQSARGQKQIRMLRATDKAVAVAKIEYGSDLCMVPSKLRTGHLMRTYNVVTGSPFKSVFRKSKRNKTGPRNVKTGAIRQAVNY